MNYDSLAIPLGLILAALGAAIVVGAARSKVASSSQRGPFFVAGLIVFVVGLLLNVGGSARGISVAQGIGVPVALVVGAAFGFWYGHATGPRSSHR